MRKSYNAEYGCTVSTELCKLVVKDGKMRVVAGILRKHCSGSETITYSEFREAFMQTLKLSSRTAVDECIRYLVAVGWLRPLSNLEMSRLDNWREKVYEIRIEKFSFLIIP
jgi:hypothetical protein